MKILLESLYKVCFTIVILGASFHLCFVAVECTERVYCQLVEPCIFTDSSVFSFLETTDISIDTHPHIWDGKLTNMFEFLHVGEVAFWPDGHTWRGPKLCKHFCKLWYTVCLMIIVKETILYTDGGDFGSLMEFRHGLSVAVSIIRHLSWFNGFL